MKRILVILKDKLMWHRATLPQGYPRSTIAAERLNFRVRNGIGCIPFAMDTTNFAIVEKPKFSQVAKLEK